MPTAPTTRKREETCAECAAFRRASPMVQGDGEVLQRFVGAIGRCQRYRLTAYVRGTDGVLHEVAGVSAIDWCGDYEPRDA